MPGYDGGRGGSRGGRGGGRGGGPDRSRGGYSGPGSSSQMAIRGGAPASPPVGIPYLYGKPLQAADVKVTKLEDKLVSSTKGKTIEGMMGRPSYGNVGRAINLRTNHFAIRPTKDAVPWYRYQIDMTPEVVGPKRRALIEQVLRDPEHPFASMTCATDYAMILVTVEPLPYEDWKCSVVLSSQPHEPAGIPATKGPATKASATEPSETKAAASDDQTRKQEDVGAQGEKEAKTQKRNAYGLRVVLQQKLVLSDLLNWLRNTNIDTVYGGRNDMLQPLNIIMRQGPNDTPDVGTVGARQFFPHQGHPGAEAEIIGNGLEALRGYYASIRPATNRLILNLNVTASAFYRPVSLVQLWSEFDGIDATRARSGDQWRKIEVFCRRLRFRTEYAEGGPRVKTFAQFCTKPPYANAEQVMIRWKGPSGTATERENTVAEFFLLQYNIRLRQPKLPVVNVRTAKEPSWIPPELASEVLAGQPYQKLLSGDQTSRMLRFAARAPVQNAVSLAGDGTNIGSGVGKGLRLFRLADPHGNAQKDSVHQWGFEIDTKMMVVKGRVLDPPIVLYDKKSRPAVRAGAWNALEHKFEIPATINRWQVLVVNNALPPGERRVLKDFETHMMSFGLRFNNREPDADLQLRQPIGHQSNRVDNDEQIRQSFEQAMRSKINIRFIVLDRADKWVYARIKYWADVKYGIGTVCCVGTKLLKSQGQGTFFSNLALKFNVKGGGVSHSVAGLIAPPVDTNTMLMGIDVTHPSPGSAESAPSIAAVVASIDSRMFAWPGSVRTQARRTEMVSELQEMFVERLTAWQALNKRLPDRIIIYRDGVSEGEYQRVLMHEIPPLEEAFKMKYGAPGRWPKLTFVIVGKRHHTRFYPTVPADTSASGNPLPGTVVDRGITSKVLFEFYLQAHHALQGTARPAHYVVVRDENNFSADTLQAFTHKLCYLFVRATKAVSVCPPAYYADLLAERARCYLYDCLAEDSTERGYNARVDWSRGVEESRIAKTTWYV